MTASESPAVSAPGIHAPAMPPLALLLDVDGPVASPVTRDVKREIIDDLVALASAGIPVVFNTGRSDAFIREQVTEKGGIFSQQCFQVKGALGGHQLVQTDRTRRERRPLLGRCVTMVGVRAALAHSFEYHPASLWKLTGQGNELPGTVPRL